MRDGGAGTTLCAVAGNVANTPSRRSNARVGGATRLWYGAEMRRHWRRHLTLTLLVAFVGAAVLTCLAAARRTDTAFERYASAHGVPQLEVYTGSEPKKAPAAARAIESVPGVALTGRVNNLFAAPDRPELVPGDDFLVFAPGDDRWGRTLDRPIVVAGRLPDPEAPDEILVNERAADELWLRVGTRFRLRSVSPREGDFLQSGEFSKIKFRGARPTVTVVGVGRSRTDLAQASYAAKYGIASHAFYEQNVDEMFGFGELVDVRVARGADIARVAEQIDAVYPRVEDATGGRGGASRIDQGTKGVTDTARAQTIALLLVALAAGIAGVITISQALARSLAAGAADQSTLSGLGMDRASRARMQAAAFVPSAVLAAVLAVVSAWVASTWFPTGTTRTAEVSTGARFDALVLLVGGALIVVAVVARVAIGTWRQRPATVPQQPAQRSAWLDRVTNTLAPPFATGVRWALARRDGTRAPSRAGVAGALVGVAGLVAVAVYVAGIDHVVSTPSAYGWTFDASAGGGRDSSQVSRVRDFLLRQPSVDDVAIVDVNGDTPVEGAVVDQIWAYRDVRGHIGPAVVQGRAPVSGGEVMVGTKTASDLGLHVGDVLRVPRRGGSPMSLRVVGLTLFPTVETDHFTRGIVVAPATFARLNTIDPYQNVVLRWRAGTDVVAEAARLDEDGELDGTLAAPTADVKNLGAVRNYPRWLAAFLVVLALLATAHALAVASRRRRHEMGILCAIGFGRRELARAVSTHGLTIGVCAVAVGLPLGFAAGRWAWVTHASNIGLGTAVYAPVAVVVGVALGAIVLTWTLAVVTSRRAIRTRLTTSLRAE